MTSQPPNPDPANTPDLEAGGGVSPGATPPAAGQTPGVANPHPPGRGHFTPTGVVAVVGVCVFVVIFVAVAVLLAMKMVGAAG
ncbi:hypothetical protein MSAS_08620 [Mycobacterium saskatchewanense]|uniref:DUF6480 family protein n=1 Tax=Mycobacterium saskatchewanense TaxID=220927 RepID=UPI000A169BF4|nr:DUF6480 family protein [Mycobacterium saskatchewanense]BBX61688.1 hypothetical protein MSAS_08620 [Mycobacterium saskatchewanense]